MFDRQSYQKEHAQIYKANFGQKGPPKNSNFLNLHTLTTNPLPSKYKNHSNPFF